MRDKKEKGPHKSDLVTIAFFFIENGSNIDLEHSDWESRWSTKVDM